MRLIHRAGFVTPVLTKSPQGNVSQPVCASNILEYFDATVYHARPYILSIFSVLIA